MKKIPLLLISFLLPVSVAFAQDDACLYFRAGLGYGLGDGSHFLGINFASVSVAGPSGAMSSSADLEGAYASYGRGFKLTAAGGWMLTKNIGVEALFPEAPVLGEIQV